MRLNGKKGSEMKRATRRLLVITATATVALALAPQALSATRQVDIRAAGFSPSTVTIATLDEVRWTNRDTVNHQVVSDTGAFASPILRPGQSYRFTFRASGTYRYRDALEPAERGTVRVTGPPPSVSLAASTGIDTYGTQITLSGQISNGRAGERVEIFSKPYPGTSFVKLAEVLTQQGGAWSYPTTPEILTSYQAHWRNNTSTEVSVAVRPRISFGRRSGFFVVTVNGQRSFANRFVYLQRLSRFGQWVNVRKVTIGSQSSRRFKQLMPKGTSRLRIFMTVNQAGAGYLGGMSGVLVFRRR
jgi:plastocyanin